MGIVFRWVSGLLLLLVCLGLKANARPSVEVEFYSSILTFPTMYCSELDLSGKRVGRPLIIDTYEHLQNCDSKDFLATCERYRTDYQLGDWHFYEVIAGASEKMYENANFQVIFQWFVLRKFRIGAQLFYREDDLFLYVPSPDAEFGFYTIQRNRKRYVNLTARRRKLDLEQRQAYLPEFLVDPEADLNFWFYIPDLPTLPSPVVIERELLFSHNNNQYQLRVRLNKDHLEMMNDYPFYSQVQFFHMGLSSEARASLLPQLRFHLQGRDTLEQVEFLLSFVRTAFFYKDDHEKFGHEKPMSPEQVLYHSYSDCEDRSALFFYLVREILNLPAIVIDFDEHVGVAVELKDATGDYFEHKGRRFVYCEATGPDDQLKIGEMWPYVRNQRARVLTEFMP